MSLILFVDDDPDIRQLYTAVLRNMDHRVFTAPDGHSGLAIAEMIEPDLVITDLNMPRMNGLELSQRLREHAQLRHIPIMLHSAEDMPGLDTVDASVHKTGSLAAFREAVTRLLEKAGAPPSTET